MCVQQVNFVFTSFWGLSSGTFKLRYYEIYKYRIFTTHFKLEHTITRIYSDWLQTWSSPSDKHITSQFYLSLKKTPLQYPNNNWKLHINVFVYRIWRVIFKSKLSTTYFYILATSSRHSWLTDVNGINSEDDECLGAFFQPLLGEYDNCNEFT